MKKFFEKLFCRHLKTKTIYIEDIIYDFNNDNDDLDDIPTILEVVYCQKCGKLISKKHTLTTPYKGHWLCMASPLYQISEFEMISGLKSRNITLN